MGFYKSEKGITMMTLVITIIILLIVSSTMIYSGVNTYQSMIKQNFLAEMRLIQAEVNKFADAYIQKAENLGLPIDSFKRVYFNEYDLSNAGNFSNYDYKEQQKYLEFYEFVNSYNGFNNKYNMAKLAYLEVAKKNNTGSVDPASKMYFIPPIGTYNSDDHTETVANRIGKEDGHKTSSGDGTLELELDEIWVNVMDSDGSQFVTVPVGGDVSDAIEVSQKNYFYFTREMASAFFNMEVSTDLAIDFDDRYVISISKSIEDEETNLAYHTEYTLQGGEKTVDHNLVLPKKDIKLDFTYNVEFEQDSKRYKITIIPNEDNTMAVKNMYYYAGYTAADQVTTPSGSVVTGLNGKAELSPNKTWNLIDGTSFYTSESEAFGIKLVDVNNNVAYGVVKVTYVNTPQLGVLKPITLDDEGNWILADEDEPWYDYENGKWGNAMIDDIAVYDENTGEIQSLGSTFVWIPRFAYRIIYFANEDNKTEYLTTGDITKVAAYSDNRGLVKVNGTEMNFDEFASNKYAQYHIVEVKFLNGTTNNDSAGIDVTTAYGGNFRVHPAFYDTVENREISGFWISKYRVTQVNAINTAAGTSINTVVSSPNDTGTAMNMMKLFMKAYTMKNNFNVKEEVYTQAELEDIDTHMMKNLEYGAVVMLTSATMLGKPMNVNQSNIMNNFGLYDMFKGQQNYVAAMSANYWNTFDAAVRQYITEAKNDGAISESVKAELENPSKLQKQYFNIYNGGTSTPEEVFGDAIYEFSFKNGTCYYIKFMEKGEFSVGTKNADYVILRGGNGSADFTNIAGTIYATSVDANAYTRVVLIAE